MGGFYGSVQVRTEDRRAVVRAAELITARAQIRCLIGPLIDGWVGTYPEDAGQDQRIGFALAREVGGDVLQIIIHDDDVMAYWLWHDGELADSYWSRPGYFSEGEREEQLQMTGDPQAFGDVLTGKERDMLAILHRRRTDLTFEGTRLQEFAALLGIANAVTSYEYLKAGELAGIDGWDEFEEVPAGQVAAEQASARAIVQLIAGEKAKLRERQLLLADVVENDLTPRACAAAGGLLVTWDGAAAGDSRLEFYRQPWGEAEPGEIETGGTVQSLAANAAGGRIAMALGNRVVAWETHDWQPILELIENDWATDAALSADGNLLAYRCRAGVFVHDVHTGTRITALGAHEAKVLAFHPSGKWIIAAGQALWLARVEGAEPWRELYPGGQAPPAGDLAGAVKNEMSRIDLDAVVARHRATLEAALAKLAASGAKDQAAAQIARKMQEQMDKHLEQMRTNLVNLKAGNVPARRQGNESVWCAGFTADGRLLYCGTDRGIRVYDWDAVANAANNSAMPPAVFSHESLSISASGASPAMIGAAVELPSSAALVFGGASGVLSSLDLTTGQVSDLVSLPDGGTIISLILSQDASAIGVCSQAPAGREQRFTWQIWSTAGLFK